LTATAFFFTGALALTLLAAAFVAFAAVAGFVAEVAFRAVAAPFLAGVAAFFAGALAAGFLAAAFAGAFAAFFTVGFFAAAVFTGVGFFFVVDAFCFAGVDFRPGLTVAVRFAAFVAVAGFFAGACFDAAVRAADRAGARLAEAAGPFRALVDLPVAFAIGRSLRSSHRPRTGKAGDDTPLRGRGQ
jgi:hypothetical protein